MPAHLDDLGVFVAVARAAGLSAAAAKLHMPKSSVSRALARLEEALSTQLVHRTTRQFRLSAAGEALLAQAEPSVAALQRALEPKLDLDTPSGLLRLTCTVDFGESVVAELVARFVARYPAVQVEVHCSNGIVDLVAGGFDLGIRFSTKRGLRDSTLVARRVGALRTQLVAAPSYLARRPLPRVPTDLSDHDWVMYKGADRFLLQAGTRHQTISARDRVRCDDMFFARAAARAGAGIALLPAFLADPDISGGTLVAVVPKWRSSTGSVWVVHPPARRIPPKVSAFRDLVVEALATG